MSRAAESSLVTVVEHLKSVVEDVEEIGATRQVITQLREEIIHLFKVIMKETGVSSVPIPSSLHDQLTEQRLSEEDVVVLDRAGVLHIRSKVSTVHELGEFPTDTVITLFNAVAPVLKEEVGRRRKADEDRLETLQALKESLAALEKKQPLRQR